MLFFKILLLTIVTKVISDIIIITNDNINFSDYIEETGDNYILYKIDDYDDVNVDIDVKLYNLERTLSLLVDSKTNIEKYSNLNIVNPPFNYFDVEDQLINFYNNVKFYEDKKYDFNINFIENIKINLLDKNLKSVIEIYIKQIINMILFGRSWYCFDKKNNLKIDSILCENKLNEIRYKLKQDIYKNILINAGEKIYSSINLEFQFMRLINKAINYQNILNDISKEYDENMLVEMIKELYTHKFNLEFNQN